MSSCFNLKSHHVFITIAIWMILTELLVDANEVCPGSSLLYHSETKKCYKYGTKGPCQNNLKIRHSPREPYRGICACEPASVIVDGIYVKVPNVLHKGKNKCFKIYTQAYCKRNEWLVYKRSKMGSNFQCVKNPCVGKTYLDYPVWVGKRCAELGYRCSTSNSGQHIGFHINGLIPSCGMTSAVRDILSVDGDRKSKCDVGQIRDSNGHCEYMVE